MLWLRADEGVDLNDSLVGTWADQSGNGNHAVQAYVRRQPVLIRGKLNGYPVVRFDGVNDRLGFTGSQGM